MNLARFTLHLPACSLAEAQALSDLFERDARLDPLAVSLNEVDETRSLWETVAYFETDAEAELARTAIAAPGAEIRRLQERDWVRESLQGLQPVSAGRFYLHGSHDRARRRAGGISLEIDAGTAFGTGHHNTTIGCLLALDAVIKRCRPANVLDLGCGTGVLAIASARAARTPTLATDIDPEAVRVTKLNATRNGVAAGFVALAAPGLKSALIANRAPYDLVMANILARPLVSLALGLSRLLSPGGTLVLSGLTANQVRWVTAAYRNCGLTLQKRLMTAHWATLVMTRPVQVKRPVRYRTGRQVAGTRGSGWEEA